MPKSAQKEYEERSTKTPEHPQTINHMEADMYQLWVKVHGQDYPASQVTKERKQLEELLAAHKRMGDDAEIRKVSDPEKKIYE
jgi:hypothetical protein